MASLSTCNQRQPALPLPLSPAGRDARVSGSEGSFSTILLRAVAADRLDRATFHRLFAQSFFLGRFGLFINIGMAAVIVATEIRRSGFTAKVAIDALVIDIELSVDIFGIFICGVSHFSKLPVKRRGY